MPVPETLFASLTFLFQDTHEKWSKLFKMLVLQHRSLQHNFDDLEKEMQKKEEAHQAEVTRLKEDLARAAKLNEV